MLLDPPLEGDVVAVDFVLQGHDQILLVLHLLNVFLLPQSHFDERSLVHLDELFKILVLSLELLDSPHKFCLLSLLNLDTHLRPFDFFLDLDEVDWRHSESLHLHCLQLQILFHYLILHLFYRPLVFLFEFFNLRLTLLEDLRHLVFEIGNDLVFRRNLEVKVCHLALHISVDIVNQVYEGVLAGKLRPHAVLSTRCSLHQSPPRVEGLNF